MKKDKLKQFTTSLMNVIYGLNQRMKREIILRIKDILLLIQ